MRRFSFANEIKVLFVIVLSVGFALPSIAREELAIPMPSWDKYLSFDPVVQLRGYSAEFYNLLAQPLVYIDNQNQIQSGVAEKFYWDKGNLHFELRKTFRTFSGHEITSEDAAYSIRRAISIDKKKAGKSISSLCNNDYSNPEESCEGIRIIDKHHLVLSFSEKKPEIIWELTNQAFLIFSRKSMNLEINRIGNYLDTTGPYYLESIDQANWTFVLKPNEGHWLINKNSPKKITVHSYYYKDTAKVMDDYKKGRYDLIPLQIQNELTKKQIKELAEFDSDSKIYVTDEILLMAFKFTNRGMSLPLETRQDLAKTLSVSVEKYFIENSSSFTKYRKKSVQFFATNAFGALDEDELKGLRSRIWQRDDKSLEGKKFEISMASHTIPSFKKVLGESLPLFKIKGEDTHLVYQGKAFDDKSTPHIAVIGFTIDSKESFNAIKFLMNYETFHLRGQAANNWFQKYVNESSQVKREQMLRKLHRESLFENVSLVPLLTKPYQSISKKYIDTSVFPKNDTLLPYWLL